MNNVKVLCCTSDFILISLNFKLVHIFLSIGMWKTKLVTGLSSVSFFKEKKKQNR